MPFMSSPTHQNTIYLSIYPSISVSVCLSIYLSIYRSIYLSIYLSIYITIRFLVVFTGPSFKTTAKFFFLKMYFAVLYPWHEKIAWKHRWQDFLLVQYPQRCLCWTEVGWWPQSLLSGESLWAIHLQANESWYSPARRNAQLQGSWKDFC